MKRLKLKYFFTKISKIYLKYLKYNQYQYWFYGFLYLSIATELYI